MNRYVAFLRGVNVSGQKIIKMEVLREVLAGAGLNDVKTHIQSGNILFTTGHRENQVILSIENLIEETFGFRTDVILRRLNDIEAIVNTNLFSTLQSDDGAKYYITFLKHEYTQPLEIPLFSKNKDVEIINQTQTALISISRQFKGNYGFPNGFIEKLTGIPATTRNPNTLEKILKL
jgi:uncharacterized protein (DUF1697 family)